MDTTLVTCCIIFQLYGADISRAFGPVNLVDPCEGAVNGSITSMMYYSSIITVKQSMLCGSRLRTMANDINSCSEILDITILRRMQARRQDTRQIIHRPQVMTR